MNHVSPQHQTEVQQRDSKKRHGFLKGRKEIVGLVLAALIFMTIFFGLPRSFDGHPRVMIAIVAVGIVLWILETIPIGLTAVLILVLMLLLHPVSIDVVYSGFASPAVFLIIGGMMLARAVNETRLARRFSYHILGRLGGNAKGLLASILIIPQAQSFFIPAAAVRTSLLLPIALNVLDIIGAKPNSRLRKMILLGVAFGGTISGTAIMTAAIGNILTVELIKELLHVKITYFEWFLYSLPLWLALIPGAWLILLKCFPLKGEEQSFPHVKLEMQKQLKAFGPLNQQEIKCLVILTTIVVLWMTEPLHGLNPSIPALIGVLLMTMPGIGCAKWSNVVKINFDTIILLGATLSMGYALNDSGAATKIGEALGAPWVLSLIQNPIIAIIFVLIATQIIHLMMSNVSTAVVTLIPIYIGIAHTAGINPVMICFAAALTCLHGYILVVETMPNVLVHGTGQISQRDFLVPGLFLTVLMMVVTLIIALTWWKWLGFV